MPEMKQPDKDLGYGNRGKTNCVFPPFPQPLLLNKLRSKAADPKQKTIVYTKYLTLPKDLLPYITLALMYFLIAGLAFHFISKAGFNLYLSIAGSLLWPLVLLLVLFANAS
jgi:hypothetical protein